MIQSIPPSGSEFMSQRVPRFTRERRSSFVSDDQPSWFGPGNPSDFLSTVRQAECPFGAAYWLGAESKLAIFRKSTAAQLKHAKQVGGLRAATPRVVAVEYDEARDRLTLEFDQGFAVAVSLRGFPGFQHATALDLRAIEILGSGDAVYFGRIDRSLNVANLLAKLTGPPTASTKPRTGARQQAPIRVQGGYVGGINGEPPPPPPKGVSSFRPLKT